MEIAGQLETEITFPIHTSQNEFWKSYLIGLDMKTIIWQFYTADYWLIGFARDLRYFITREK